VIVMRALHWFAMAVLCVAACSSKSTPPDASTVVDTASAIDAPPGTPDAAGTPDASARTCTGALYDPCNNGTQCNSGMCMNFAGAGIQVCTQSCATTACPDQNGNAVTCSNNTKICKPPQANACTP
jgi:hypothetical protein